MDHRAGAVRLALPGELLLLALDDERGTRAHATELEPGLAGAVLLDLALRGRLDVDGKTPRAVDPAPTGGLRAGRGAGHHRPREQAPPRQALGGQAPERGAPVSDRLVAAGTLRRDTKKVLWLFPATRLPASDLAPEAAVRVRLDDAVLRGPSPDERTAALASLVHATGLGRTVFPDADRRAVEARLAELSGGRWAAEAVRRVVQETAAATTAVITAATVTTMSGS